MTSAKSRSTYSKFLEEMKKNKWIQLDCAVENATNQFSQKMHSEYFYGNIDRSGFFF